MALTVVNTGEIFILNLAKTYWSVTIALYTAAASPGVASVYSDFTPINATTYPWAAPVLASTWATPTTNGAGKATTSALQITWLCNSSSSLPTPAILGYYAYDSATSTLLWFEASTASIIISTNGSSVTMTPNMTLVTE